MHYATKNVADIKRFLRIFRYVLMECLFGMTNSKEGPPSFLYSPQQIAVDNDNLCDMDISDIKRFFKYISKSPGISREYLNLHWFFNGGI